MSRILTLDPGLRTPGLAVFEDGVLTWATCVSKDTGCRGPQQWAAIAKAVGWAFSVTSPTGEPVDLLIVEKPQVYTRSNADHDDLIELSAALGACVQAVCDVFYVEDTKAYLPREWKGQIKKPVHHRRIRRELSGTEEAALKAGLRGVAPGLHHNALDAVGLGLKYLRRIK